jgi:hypothetical protein
MLIIMVDDYYVDVDGDYFDVDEDEDDDYAG